MKNGLACLLLVLLGHAGASIAQTSAKDQAEAAAAVAKANADALESELRAKTAQYDLQQLDATKKLAAAKAQKEYDDGVATAKAAAEKAAQDAKDKQVAAITSASKSLSELQVKGDIKDFAVGGTPIETQMLSYRALSVISTKLTQDLKPETFANKTGVILAQEGDIEGLYSYKATKEKFLLLEKNYKSVIDKAETEYAQLISASTTNDRSAAVVGLALEGVKALAALAQTFQTQFHVNSVDVSIEQMAMNAALAQAWSKSPVLRTIPLYRYPGLSAEISTTEIGANLSRLTELLERSSRLQVRAADWLLQEQKTIDAMSAKIAAAKAAKKTLADSETKALSAKTGNLEQVKTLVADLKKTDDRVAGTIDTLTATSETKPVSILANLVRAGYMADKVQAGMAMLIVKVVSAGGNTLSTNNIWTGPKLFHSGGAIVAYTLISTDGVLVSGDVLASHTGYVRLDRKEINAIGNSWTSIAPKTVSPPETN
ncbi:hypothetical protein [Undibacterium terreum]|uniref:Uncharacterized protein n=1 Tax=Undibacterium terreum TaxID=1224302 RepID=A0A916UY46_9BURK|nr:hypothetical protein [Undibacterium terreum]GGC93575.1 hypothetical protein GCM10011396_46100 [Undibacterium terreum]